MSLGSSLLHAALPHSAIPNIRSLGPPSLHAALPHSATPNIAASPLNYYGGIFVCGIERRSSEVWSCGMRLCRVERRRTERANVRSRGVSSLRSNEKRSNEEPSDRSTCKKNVPDCLLAVGVGRCLLLASFGCGFSGSGSGSGK